MAVASNIIFNRCSAIGSAKVGLTPSVLRSIYSFSPPLKGKIESLGSVPVKSSAKKALQHGCNFQFIRHTSESASIAKAMANAAKPLVICGPSGVGKSSIVGKLQEEFGDCFALCVSHTTRKPRENEVDGVNYFFVLKDEFQDAKERGEFIETAEFAGHMYGTSRGAITRIQMAGLICILDIEMKGVHQIKKTPGLNPHYVFIRPPSLEDLEARLRARKSETEESIKKRLERAGDEMEYGSKAENFDLVITNETLDTAAQELREFMIVHIEELKRLKSLLTAKKKKKISQ